MQVTRVSALSGKKRTRELDVTVKQVMMYNDGALIQDAFPNLSDDDREFYMTGITKEEWDKAFGDE